MKEREAETHIAQEDLATWRACDWETVAEGNFQTPQEEMAIRVLWMRWRTKNWSHCVSSWPKPQSSGNCLGPTTHLHTETGHAHS